MRGSTSGARICAGIALATFLVPGAARGQTNTRSVVPGPNYTASPLREAFFGRTYRDQWTAPMQVEVLDLASFAGGLEPDRIGGGLQTTSLRFKGADGKEYTFRSIDKVPAPAVEPAVKGTVIGKLIQDQTSSLHIGGPFAVPVMLDAVGVLHATPSIYVMPDDPRLGEFRAQFAGMLGSIEERINDQEKETPGFGGFTHILDTETLLKRLEDSPEDRIDARAYLKARLFDLFINDWDRHEDQWRWAAVERDGIRWWLAIPRDRDYAFVDYEGIAIDLLRRVARNTVEFTPTIDNVYGLTLNARNIDRHLLNGLSREVFDSTAMAMQGELTDAVIERAMRRMPPEVQALSAEWTAARLRSRRDDLRNAAEIFYKLLATDVDVHATDKRDVAVVDRTGDGALLVRLYDVNKEGLPHGDPYFERSFRRAETSEVRVYLHGGADHAIVRGVAHEGLTLRVIGGGGDDLLADSSSLGRGKTAFYDDRGENRFIRGPVTRVDESAYEEPARSNSTGIAGESVRDAGHSESKMPSIGWRGEDGPILGATWSHKRFGFRKYPYAWKVSVGGQVGTFSGALAAEVRGDVMRQNSTHGISARVRASQLESMRFFGFGNETPSPESSSFYLVRRDELLGEIAYHLDFAGGGTARFGPIAKVGRNELPAGAPFTVDGVGERRTAQLGAFAELGVDRRDDPVFPRRGMRAELDAAGYPVAGNEHGAFGEANALAAAYWTADATGAPTVAVRAGAKKVWGDYPVHEAAFLGGSRSVRGYRSGRYAGDALTFGSVELRQPLTTAKLLVRGKLGVTLLADGGRVFYANESSDAWHGALGAGLWFHFRIRNAPLGTSVTFAKGEVSRLYLKFGAPF